MLLVKNETSSMEILISNNLSDSHINEDEFVSVNVLKNMMYCKEAVKNQFLIQAII